MKKTRLKELLKEAFNKGRDYQYDINPYNGKLKEDSKALSFTKWYNQVKNIEVIHCCKSDSEQLRDEKEPTTLDAFLAGYKKRAKMSGLKYDEVSELHAKTLYKCWNSFDLNP